MAHLNQIGLDKDSTKKLADKLNELLANYSLFYQNTRGYHWNIKGDKFFELHIKFEELYTDLFMKIDEIAERIVTLGFSAHHNFSDYIRVSKVMEAAQVNDTTLAVQDTINSFKIIILIQREVLEIAESSHDGGTADLMNNYIRAQEKLTWMYSAFLGK